MKNNYKGFSGWIRYIQDYKDNVDNDLISEQRLIDANKEIEHLTFKIDGQKYIQKEQNELIQKLDARIQKLNGKCGGLKKSEKELTQNLAKEQEINQELQNKLEMVEKRRRVNATTIGQKQRKINKLEKEMAQLEENHKLEVARLKHRINFLENSKHAPSKEEILAYEKSMKEVEKRIKATNEGENRELQVTNN